MALFNRDYDRNYGYRGSGRTGYGSDFGGRGYDRDLGDRAGGTWESMKRGTRDMFGMNNQYDRGFRGGYDRDMNTTYNRGSMGGNDRDVGYSSTPGYGNDYRGRGATGGYDQPYWGYDTARYDRHYKSRAQTDAGDPFGDRESGTPMRVIDEPRDRGGWFGSGGYDRNYGYDRDLGYDRGLRGNRAGYGTDYRAANPMGYDPYDNRGGENQRLGRTYDAGFRGNRGYDRDWF